MASVVLEQGVRRGILSRHGTGVRYSNTTIYAILEIMDHFTFFDAHLLDQITALH